MAPIIAIAVHFLFSETFSLNSLSELDMRENMHNFTQTVTQAQNGTIQLWGNYTLHHCAALEKNHTLNYRFQEKYAFCILRLGLPAAKVHQKNVEICFSFVQDANAVLTFVL